MRSAELPNCQNPVSPLSVRNLTKRYGEEPVIDRVTRARCSALKDRMAPARPLCWKRLSAFLPRIREKLSGMANRCRRRSGATRSFTCRMACVLIGTRRPARWCLFLLASTGDRRQRLQIRSVQWDSGPSFTSACMRCRRGITVAFCWRWLCWRLIPSC